MTEFGPRTESTFVAIIAARAGPDRPDRQDPLRRAADTLSRDPALAADIEVTAGDEVRALLASPVAVVPVLQRLSDAIHPEQFAFGIGVGLLSTTLPAARSARRPARLDGPCCHAARTALGAAQKRGAWATVAGFGALDEPLTALLELIGRLRQRWTDRQGGYAVATRTAAQKDVAAAFDVSPSVVSESLKAANFDVVRRGEAGAIALFRHYAGLEPTAPASNPGAPADSRPTPS